MFSVCLTNFRKYTNLETLYTHWLPSPHGGNECLSRRPPEIPTTSARVPSALAEGARSSRCRRRTLCGLWLANRRLASRPAHFSAERNNARRSSARICGSSSQGEGWSRTVPVRFALAVTTRSPGSGQQGRASSKTSRVRARSCTLGILRQWTHSGTQDVPKQRRQKPSR